VSIFDAVSRSRNRYKANTKNLTALIPIGIKRIEILTRKETALYQLRHKAD
jgi:hypothetical protein